jgi:LPXTG-motif cell wall-anchored protein
VFFPFALTVIGVSLILLGIFFQKNRKKIETHITNRLPEFIMKLRPKRNM